MKRLMILTATLLVCSATYTFAQDVAKRPGEGDVQRVGGQWRYMHRYWTGPGHENPNVCWQWDPIDGRYEWECE